MLFSSPIFLFLFLPIVLLLYYLVPKNIKNAILLTASIFFYSWGEQLIVAVMLTSTVVDYYCGLYIEKGNRKTGLFISLVANLSFLVFFKYFNFAFTNFSALLHFFGINNQLAENLPHIALPLGISFYTFQTMSYTIDVYKGNVKANRNFIDFATYVTMFPQLVAGPIVRYIDINKQLKNKNISWQNFSNGIERFVIGLAKKMIIANSCAYVADNILDSNIADLSTSMSWMAIIAYTFQIYFDFSGYSDMAIGLGKMFGFDFPENFNYPYISRSVKEFWRRWHISMSTWFRDYVYIPLGGSRVKLPRIYINLLITFFITGLWHGASWNFVTWGFFHGFFIVIERIGFDKILQKIWRPLQHLYTIIVFVIAWVFFRIENFDQSVLLIKKMFSFSQGNLLLNEYLCFHIVNRELLIIGTLATIFSLPVYHNAKTFVMSCHFCKRNGTVLKTLWFLFILLLFALSLSYTVSDTYNPFIYFRF